MATFILVHGSWHGAWCWEYVIPLLEAYGHTVLAPDLPGHGKDTTPIKKITLKNYVDCIAELVKNTNQVILVGHSMAGIVISQVAERLPEHIKFLVYVSAFLPKNGESMFQVAAKQPVTRFVKMMKALPEKNAFIFPFEEMKEFAYHLSDKMLSENVCSRLCVEPLLPLNTGVVLTEKFERIPRIYVECLEDRAILIQSQRAMQQETPCKTYALNCDHSPFYSDPKGLVELLLRFE